MKLLSALLLAVLFLCSCSNPSLDRFENLYPQFKAEGVTEAIACITEKGEELYDDNSTFLYNFDLGTLNHYLGNYKTSEEYFNDCEKIYDSLYTISITNSAASVLTNDNARPYVARPFEMLLLHEFRVLNRLAMGDVEGAAVEVKKAQISMETLYQKDNKKVNDNGFLRYLTALVYEMGGDTDDAAIAYYETIRAYNEETSKLKLPSQIWQYSYDRLRAADRYEDLGGIRLPEPPAVETGESELVVVVYGGHSPILGDDRFALDYNPISGVVKVTPVGAAEDAKSGIEIQTPPLKDKIPEGVIPPGINIENMIGSIQFDFDIAAPSLKPVENRIENFEMVLDGGTKIPVEEVLNTEYELDQNLADETLPTLIRGVIRMAINKLLVSIARKKSEIVADLMEKALKAKEVPDARIGLFMPRTINVIRTPVSAGRHKMSLYVNGNANQFEMNIYVKSGEKKFVVLPVLN